MVNTYLVTGGSGFIGSHLVDALLRRGERVVALDNLSTGRRSNLEGAVGNADFRLVEGSVLDEVTVDELVHECDVVVHLAAAVGVKLIVEQRLQSMTTNIRGSEIVMSAAHRHGRKILVTSTSEIYGKNAAGPLSESSDRILGPPTVARWAYSTAKAVDEILADAYHKEWGLPTLVVRLFNTVGPRQSAAYGMVIPRLVRQALAGEALTIFGGGAQTRCFCHVGDIVAALLALLDHPGAVGEVFNVGSTDEISIIDLARRVVARTNSPSTIDFIAYEDAYGVGIEDTPRRVPDTAKLRALTGWRPATGLDQILAETIAEAIGETATPAIPA